MSIWGLDTSRWSSNRFSHVINSNHHDKIIEIGDARCLLQSVAVCLPRRGVYGRRRKHPCEAAANCVQLSAVIQKIQCAME